MSGENRDLTAKVERMPAFEERLGVRMDGISAFCDGPDDDGEYRVEVRGELYALGTTREGLSCTVKVVVYDGAGRVVETGLDFVDMASGYGVFSIASFPKAKPERLKVFPEEG